ncbi:MAG TPA: peptidoglycan DD-metalloendopeptidase family protein, partial [Longimicrobiales bacterium]|nr:peptidoglycan DD-metalloendopeptidase family protein [Longimicrobiales bacterium]
TVLEPRNSLNNQATAPVLAPLYAPPVESLQSYTLQPGQALSAMLMEASITGPDLTELLRSLHELRSPRSIPAGIEVTVRRWVETGEPRTVEVMLNPDTTVRLVRAGMGWSSSVTVTPIIVDTVFVSGVINEGGSLYLSIGTDTTLSLPQKERVQLVSELADIYEYKIDFLHEIHAGDRYAFAYEREARPDGTARRRRVLVARLDNQGKRYDAIYFNQGKIAGYYDLEGRSLRRGFRRYPIDYVRITSSFAARRYHPILGIYRAHLGTDFGAARGTPVRSTGDGTVIFVGRDGGYGNVVMIRHINGYTTRYAHLSRFESGIRRGRRVKMSERIGYVGSTGLATAPHLHYELRHNGRAIDFSRARLPAAPPLPATYQDDYRALMKQRVALLEEAALGTRMARTRTNANPAVGGGM